MNFDNDNHIYYIYRLISKIKFGEIDETELSDFVGSPWGTEILKKIIKEGYGKYPFISNNKFILPETIIKLILDRIANWGISTKKTVSDWDDSEIRRYLIDMIEPYNYTEDIISMMIKEFKERIKE